VLKWVQDAAQLGVGEILLTSIDREGTRKGLDLELVTAVRDRTNLPLIISGGLREPRDFTEAVFAGADAVAVADALHYRRFGVAELRSLSNLVGRNPIGRPIE
jgi:cyclase